MAYLELVLLPAAHASDREASAAEHESFKRFACDAACERVLGWALQSMLRRGPQTPAPATAGPTPGQPLVVTTVLHGLLDADRDGCYRRAFDQELLDMLSVGRVHAPIASLVEVFMRLQQQLLADTQSRVALLRAGPLAVCDWLDRFRHSRDLWTSFLAVCEGAGLLASVPAGTLPAAHEQLRQLLGQLVSKYVHANFTALLRHTQLLAAKDRADVQALRDERRADAVASATGSGRSKGTGAKRAAVAAGAMGTAPKPCVGNIACRKCRKRNQGDQMLICEYCLGGWHNFCVGVEGIPDDDWFCGVMCRTGYADAKAKAEREAAAKAARAAAAGSLGDGARPGGSGLEGAAVEGAAPGVVQAEAEAGAVGGLAVEAAVRGAAEGRGRVAPAAPAPMGAETVAAGAAAAAAATAAAAGVGGAVDEPGPGQDHVDMDEATGATRVQPLVGAVETAASALRGSKRAAADEEEQEEREKRPRRSVRSGRLAAVAQGHQQPPDASLAAAATAAPPNRKRAATDCNAGGKRRK